ncbi:MAG TPA: GNAT family N-acetyltransferase [Anaerolineales bacterium]|jgi:ribosomal protein S18 acetylase RimI-like enzyme|nr:GNAT family N-acetyltransferase [Anaerolineales bacterium]
MENKRANAPAFIRLYRREDLESCRALWVELTEWHRYIYQSPGIGGSDPGRHFDEHLNRVGPELIWVAEVGGQVVGLAGLILGEQEAELEPLVVSEPYRRLGIGRQLTEAAITAARTGGVHQIKVRPVARNKPAIAFYHAMGFDILGQIELFTDFGPADRQVWKLGERLADKHFRV